MTYLLNTYRLSRYLIGRKQIDSVPKKVQSGATNDQHFLFDVTWEDGEKWFIKQLIYFDPSERFNLVNEANAVRVISNITLLDSYSTKFVLYDTIHKILITEYPPGYKSIADDLSVISPVLLINGNLLEEAGKTIAHFHIYLTEEVRSSVEKLPFYFFKPPLLANNVAYLNPLLNNELLSPLIREWLVSFVLKPSVSEHLLALSQSWITESIIHGDATFSNLLVHSMDKKQYNLKLCDWEFAGWGDRDWDSANFFQGFLSAYMDRKITHAHLMEAGKRYFIAYKEIYPSSMIFPSFAEWFTKVLRFSAVSLLERLLGDMMKAVTIDPRNNEWQSYQIEFLFTKILINSNLLISF